MSRTGFLLLRPPQAVTVAALLPPTQLSKAPPGFLAPSPVPSGERLRGPESRPEPLTNDEALGSAGDCLCLGLGRGCVRVSRAPAPRSPSQSSATHAPRSVPQPSSGWAGSFPLPVLRSRAITPPLTLHEFHDSLCSSAPVPESAPATSGACSLPSPQSPAI